MLREILLGGGKEQGEKRRREREGEKMLRGKGG